MIRFHPRYFLLAVLLFVIEVLIALYMHDRFIRPYFGDVLVVVFLYCCVRAILKAPVLAVATGVLLFAYLIETLQYFHLVDRLGLSRNALARTVIGYGFDWLDLLAYTVGYFAILLTEATIRRRVMSQSPQHG